MIPLPQLVSTSFYCRDEMIICFFLSLMACLFPAECCGVGRAKAGKICGSMTFQDGDTSIGCDSNKSTDKFTHEVISAGVCRCVAG
jgi:hypothetical protein